MKTVAASMFVVGLFVAAAVGMSVGWNPVESFTRQTDVDGLEAQAPVLGAGGVEFREHRAPSDTAVMFKPIAVTGPGFNQVTGAQNAAEPTGGVDWNTPDTVMFRSGQGAHRVTFDAAGAATWHDVTVPEDAPIHVDPMLHVDERTGRAWSGGLVAAAGCSDMVMTDNLGDTWSDQYPCSFVGADHQTIGSGPWAEPAPPTATYERAVYYCSQAQAVDVLGAVGFVDDTIYETVASPTGCSVSHDGGATWLPGVPWRGGCGSLHGHVRVSEVTGTAAVPDKSCGGGVMGFVRSQDNGLTWNTVQVPGATQDPSGGFDPSLDFGRDPLEDDGSPAEGWLYFGYAGHGGAYIALSKDDGDNWAQLPTADGSGTTTWQNVAEFYAGTPILSGVFGDVRVGDDERAAISFMGATAPSAAAMYTQCNAGQYVWHYYVAITYDGAQTWNVQKLTDDPVQVGAVWDAGGGEACRNLLDFQDMDIDEKGRLIISYADGCVDACAAAPSPGASREDWGHILRQSAGMTLFSAFDVEDSFSATALVPASGTVNVPVTLGGVVSGGTGPYTYAWSIESGSGSLVDADPNDAAASFTPDALGVHTLKLTVTDANAAIASDVGTFTATASGGSPYIQIDAPADGAEVEAGPTAISGIVNRNDDGGALLAEGGGPYSGQVGTAISLGGSASGGAGPYSYAWSVQSGPGDGTFGDPNLASTTFTPDATGAYTLQLDVTDTNNDVATDTADLTSGDSTTPSGTRLGTDPAGDTATDGCPTGGAVPCNGAWIDPVRPALDLLGAYVDEVDGDIRFTFQVDDVGRIFDTYSGDPAAGVGSLGHITEIGLNVAFMTPGGEATNSGIGYDVSAAVLRDQTQLTPGLDRKIQADGASLSGGGLSTGLTPGDAGIDAASNTVWVDFSPSSIPEFTGAMEAISVRAQYIITGSGTNHIITVDTLDTVEATTYGASLLPEDDPPAGESCNPDAADDAAIGGLAPDATGLWEILDICATTTATDLEVSVKTASNDIEQALSNAMSPVVYRVYVDGDTTPYDVGFFLGSASTVFYGVEDSGGSAQYKGNAVVMTIPLSALGGSADSVRAETWTGEGTVAISLVGPNDSAPDIGGATVTASPFDVFGVTAMGASGDGTPGTERVHVYVDNGFCGEDTSVDTSPEQPAVDDWAVECTLVAGEHTLTAEWYGADDALLASDSITVTSTGEGNLPPTAAATASPTTTDGGDAVTLDGAGSNDADGNIASYQWTETTACGGALTGAGTDTATWIAPDGPLSCTFQLEVTDDGEPPLSDTDTVTVTVNAPPTTMFEITSPTDGDHVEALPTITGTVQSSAVEPRVVIGITDAGLNIYHDFYYESGTGDDGYQGQSPIYPAGSPPDSVTDALLDEMGIDQGHRVTLTRTGVFASDFATDADIWAAIEASVGGTWWYFEGTNVIATSYGTLGKKILPDDDDGDGLDDDSSRHGTGTTGAALTANAEAVMVFSEDFNSDASLARVARAPVVDIISHSFGFQVPLVGTPLPNPFPTHATYEAVVQDGKLVFSSAGNGPTPAWYTSSGGLWWNIGVGGIHDSTGAEGPSQDDYHSWESFASWMPDFAADYRQDLPYCRLCTGPDGTAELTTVGGTSFSTPYSAGVASQILLEARRGAAHVGGIKDTAEGPAMVVGAADARTNWDIRRALEEAARLYGVDDYDAFGAFGVDPDDPLGFNIPLLPPPSVPIINGAQWSQIGWGIIDLEIVDEALDQLMDPGPRKSSATCAGMLFLHDLRFEYWNQWEDSFDAAVGDPYLRCDPAAAPAVVDAGVASVPNPGAGGSVAPAGAGDAPTNGGTEVVIIIEGPSPAMPVTGTADISDNTWSFAPPGLDPGTYSVTAVQLLDGKQVASDGITLTIGGACVEGQLTWARSGFFGAGDTTLGTIGAFQAKDVAVPLACEHIALDFHLDWSDTNADLDIRVGGPAGQSSGAQGGSSSYGEEVHFPAADGKPVTSGLWDVEVEPWLITSPSVDWDLAVTWTFKGVDTDLDGVPDLADLCQGLDDLEDLDMDGDADCLSPEDNGDADGDGVENHAEFCPETPPGAEVDEDGCADQDGDGLREDVDPDDMDADTDGDGIPDGDDPDATGFTPHEFNAPDADAVAPPSPGWVESAVFEDALYNDVISPTGMVLSMNGDADAPAFSYSPGFGASMFVFNGESLNYAGGLSITPPSARQVGSWGLTSVTCDNVVLTMYIVTRPTSSPYLAPTVLHENIVCDSEFTAAQAVGGYVHEWVLVANAVDPSAGGSFSFGQHWQQSP